MEISVVNGLCGEYRYEGIWWRLDGEVHWKAHVFSDDGIAATPAGTLRPETRGSEDANVRKTIEIFIETSEQSLKAQRDAGPPA